MPTPRRSGAVGDEGAEVFEAEGFVGAGVEALPA